MRAVAIMLDTPEATIRGYAYNTKRKRVPPATAEEDRDSRAGTPKTPSCSRHLGGATWTPSIRRPPTPKKAQLAFGTGQHAGICAPPGAAPSLNS